MNLTTNEGVMTMTITDVTTDEGGLNYELNDSRRSNDNDYH